MDKEKIILESIKLAAANLQLNGVSPKEVIIHSIQYLMELYQPEQGEASQNQEGGRQRQAILAKAILLTEAYIELGFPYESSQALFEQIFHTAGLTEDEIRSFQRRCAEKLRLNKSKIGSVLGRWNPRDHSDTKKNVIEDIMEKIKNHEQGEYFYYSRWKYPRQEDIYQLVVEPEGSYLCHVNRQKYYEFEDMG